MADHDRSQSPFTRLTRMGRPPASLARTVGPAIQKGSTILLSDAAALYDTIRIEDGRSTAWGNPRWRIDAALTYRFSAHVQLKAQYSLDHEDHAPREVSHNLAGQFTIRF